MKDPYYRKILERLAGPLDRDEFEECAVDLLQDTYRLVPIHGGQDRGMDGGISDGEGEAYPLVSTTGQDVSGNLRKSLESYRAQGGTRNRVVLATSQALTSKRRQNLEERARERGFVLVQIHDQRDFAARLYRNSRWAKELLRLTGEPSALSAVPLARRPLREDLELIGRDADLAWLVETPGDKLLVGQPGMGKTHLLLQLVRQGGALFLTSEDEGAIIAALRDLQPRIVLVDDAHTAPETLVRLRRLRRGEEVGAEFDLVATAWPGTEDDVRDALGTLPAGNVRELEGLTRRQIVQVLRGIGVDAPDDDPHLRALVDQSANKPGLAVTLGTLWQRGEWREVLTGQAIRPVSTLQLLLEHPDEEIALAAAAGEWSAPPANCARTVVSKEWRRAILRFGARSEVDGGAPGGAVHRLKQIFRSDPALAFDWLVARLEEANKRELPHERGVYKSVIEGLDLEQRRSLLQKVRPSFLSRQLLPWLIGDSPELYESLLARDDWRDFHLKPFDSETLGERWRLFASLALGAGHTPASIARAVVRPAFGGWGHGIDRWAAWKATFEALLQDGHEVLGPVAQHGLKIAEDELTKAQAEERRVEMTGQF